MTAEELRFEAELILEDLALNKDNTLVVLHDNESQIYMRRARGESRWKLKLVTIKDALLRDECVAFLTEQGVPVEDNRECPEKLRVVAQAFLKGLGLDKDNAVVVGKHWHSIWMKGREGRAVFPVTIDEDELAEACAVYLVEQGAAVDD